MTSANFVRPTKLRLRRQLRVSGFQGLGFRVVLIMTYEVVLIDNKDVSMVVS